MPWTIKDVDKHKKGLTDKQKKKWVAVANSSYNKCIAAGGTDETCAPKAIKQANGVTNMQVYAVFNNEYEIREEKLQNKDYLVVPIIMMVEGVHNGSHGAILHTAEELGKLPESWNGIPVMINHPMDEDGVSISANSPEVLEQYKVGSIYNAKMIEKKLAAEAWLELERLEQISIETSESILNMELLEVSVGVFNDSVDEQGTWEEEEYEAIATNYRPDHLALLPGSIGACSIEDGCGIRSYKKGGDDMDVNAVVTGMEKKRKELNMSVDTFYAVPRDPPSASKLPIFDTVHVRNALARFSQTIGLTADEKAKAKKKILAKAKKFDIDASSLETDEQMEMIQSLNAGGYAVARIGNYEEQGYQQRLNLVYDALRGLNSQNTYNYLEELYDNYLIYQREGDGKALYFKQFYKIVEEDEVNKVELVGEAIPVKKKTEYITFERKQNVNLKEEDKMTRKNDCCEDVINELINNERTKFTEEDKAWLETLEEDQLLKLMPEASKKEEPKKKEEPVQVNTKPTQEQAIEVLRETLKDSEGFIGLLPKNMQDSVRSGLALHEEARQKMVTAIMENAKDVWAKEELEAMNFDTLRKVHSSIPEIADYSLKTTSKKNNTEEPKEVLTMPGVELKEE